MIPKRLEQFDKEKLINIVVRQDRQIESLEDKVKNISYVGRIFIKDKYYSFYIKPENDQ